jgi:hypothetical protein
VRHVRVWRRALAMSPAACAAAAAAACACMPQRIPRSQPADPPATSRPSSHMWVLPLAPRLYQCRQLRPVHACAELRLHSAPACRAADSHWWHWVSHDAAAVAPASVHVATREARQRPGAWPAAGRRDGRLQRMHAQHRGWGCARCRYHPGACLHLMHAKQQTPARSAGDLNGVAICGGSCLWCVLAPHTSTLSSMYVEPHACMRCRHAPARCHRYT